MTSTLIERPELVVGEPPPPPAVPDTLYEVVNGLIVEPTPMGSYECLIAAALDQTLGPFARANQLGRVAPETLFVIDNAAGLQRRPDVAFVSFARWARGRRIPRTPAWDVVPDLAIEVVSPSNTAFEVLDKLHEYFRAGVGAVWVVYPNVSEVYAYTSPTAVRVLTRADELDGGAVLPGFRLPLAELFEDEGATD